MKPVRLERGLVPAPCPLSGSKQDTGLGCQARYDSTLIGREATNEDQLTCLRGAPGPGESGCTKRSHLLFPTSSLSPPPNNRPRCSAPA